MMENKRFSLDEMKTEGEERVYHLNYGEQGLMSCTDEEKQVIEQLVINLNRILLENEVETKSYRMMMEFYQKVIADTLADKLAEIDNMYAMKKMMEEITQSLENMANRITAMNENGDFDKIDEKGEIIK